MRFSISLIAQNIKVPAKLSAAFAKLYPKATEVKWDKEGENEFEASFKLDGLAVVIVIDSKGEVKETESEIKKTHLPKGVEEYIAKNCKEYAITETTKIVDSKKVTTFEVEITKGKEKKDLTFTSEGKPIVKNEKKEKDEEKEK